MEGKWTKRRAADRAAARAHQPVHEGEILDLNKMNFEKNQKLMWQIEFSLAIGGEIVLGFEIWKNHLMLLRVQLSSIDWKSALVAYNSATVVRIVRIAPEPNLIKLFEHLFCLHNTIVTIVMCIHNARCWTPSLSPRIRILCLRLFGCHPKANLEQSRSEFNEFEASLGEMLSRNF